MFENRSLSDTEREPGTSVRFPSAPGYRKCSVILRETAHAATVEHTRTLIAVPYRARPWSGRSRYDRICVWYTMIWNGQFIGLTCVLLVDLHRRVHVIVVKSEVPEVSQSQDRPMCGVYSSSYPFAVTLVIFDRDTHSRPFRVPVDQTGAGFLVRGEQIELLAEPPVVTPLDVGEQISTSSAPSGCPAVPYMRCSILFFSSPRQYAPAIESSLNPSGWISFVL